MRLLQIRGPGQFNLTEDFITNVLPYAILSHTWGDEEVVFRDLVEGGGKDKKGYRKIQFCGDQAARDGLQYFWVDTCCIDKSNNVELTEAINSMFRWYRNSAKCYVYLPDVSAGSSEAGQSSKERWEPAFRQSRWFTRGWTLQELIAPSSVEFFSEEGDRLGDRDLMDRQISEITGVHIDAFRGRSLSSFSIDERMAWAEKRNTTREEDAAYSLLGIFEIFMPLIYGEGRPNALNRLLKEVNSDPKLPVAAGASFDSYLDERNATCLEETRVELRRDIMAWIDDPQGEQMFWLSGMAGTGKSTISRTIAQTLARRGQLGASFFFRKGEDERRRAIRFFTTIATDLARLVPGVRSSVRRAIEADPKISDKPLKEQFEKLILQPLSEIDHRLLRVAVIVLVIDALDECDGSNDMETIIQLLSWAKDVQPVSFRVFATSRPEGPIRLAFERLPAGGLRELKLHEVPNAAIEHDLIVFFRYELAKIREERRLGTDWPGYTTITKLARMATPLFIFAATACRFIGEDRGNPKRRLETVVQGRTTGVSKLDRTYLPILGHLFDVDDEEERDELAREFREVVGPIVLLASPLSSTSLARLVSIPKEDIDSRLYSLHSVLHIPGDDNTPIRLLHKSFHDFVLDPQKRSTSSFWIDERGTHQNLATKCIELMSGVLKKDICGSGRPGSRRKHVDSQVINKYIPPEVQYACRYWVYHVAGSQVLIRDGDQVHSFLRKYFLYWLEALSLLGAISEGFSMITSLLSFLELGESVELSHFLDDAKRLLLHNWPVIEEAPLQLYSSVIIFAPEKSIIRATFKGDHFPTWVTRLSKLEEDWTTSLRVLEDNGGPITALAFSPDGKLLASAGNSGMLRLSDATNGECRNTLNTPDKIHKCIYSVDFSPDSKLVASSHQDHTVRLWDAATGACRSTLHHPKIPSTALFSPDGALVASGCDDGQIRLWSVASGECCGTFEGHPRYISAISFSPDSRLVASTSPDYTVRLWEITTGACRITFDHPNVSSVVFSPDGRLIASYCYREVKLWDVASGECRRTLKGHLKYISAIAFSSNCRLIASASADCTVRLWDVTTGDCRHVLKGHKFDVRGIAISPDNRLVASISQDTTVRLWDTATGACYNTLKGHYASVDVVAFSPDSKLVASGSHDCQIRLWDTTHAGHSSIPDAHSMMIMAMAFSPNGKLVASGSRDGTIRISDAVTGVCRNGALEGNSKSIVDVAFSHDGGLIASVSDDNTVRLWEVATGACRQTLNIIGCTHALYGVVFSPQSKLVAVFTYYQVRLWDVATGEHHSESWGYLDRPIYGPGSIAFSPDSRLFATATGFNQATVWDVITGACRRLLWHRSGGFAPVSFSPNSELVACVSSDNCVLISDIATEAYRRWLPRCSSPITALAFSSNGKLIATASRQTVDLWDIASGACHATINTQVHLRCLSFSADGSFLDTEYGQISTGDGCEGSPQQKPLPRLFIRENWITCGLEDILWLHPDFRLRKAAINGCDIVLGHRSGNLVFMTISDHSDYAL